MNTLKPRIASLLQQLNERVFEKEHIVALALLSAVAGESIFLLGPPGVAKSMVGRRLKLAFRNASAFEYLMSRFSTPDEIFGPVSISKLKDEDTYERIVDGYLPKPFHLVELNARIKSVIRRHQQGGENSIKYGNIEIFPDKYGVTVAGKKLELNRKEYDILVYFMNRPGRLVNKSTLAESVWGDHIDQVDNFDFIYAQIKNLRKRLKEAGATPELKAVYGFGYKMVVE